MGRTEEQKTARKAKFNDWFNVPKGEDGGAATSAQKLDYGIGVGMGALQLAGTVAGNLQSNKKELDKLEAEKVTTTSKLGLANQIGSFQEADLGRENEGMAGLSGAISGASAGIAAGPIGAIVGGVVGLASGLIGSSSRNQNNKRTEERLNNEQLQNFQSANASISENNINNTLMNYAAFGGRLGQDSFSNGLTEFGTGGSHEENPFGGIPQGVDEQGKPNMVEQGEIKYNNFIYSKRLNLKDEFASGFNLDTKFVNKDFAHIGKKITKESEERPFDPISRNTRETLMNRLAEAQETQKAEDRVNALSEKVGTQDVLYSRGGKLNLNLDNTSLVKTAIRNLKAFGGDLDNELPTVFNPMADQNEVNYFDGGGYKTNIMGTTGIDPRYITKQQLRASANGMAQAGIAASILTSNPFPLLAGIPAAIAMGLSYIAVDEEETPEKLKESVYKAPNPKNLSKPQSEMKSNNTPDPTNAVKYTFEDELDNAPKHPNTMTHTFEDSINAMRGIATPTNSDLFMIQPKVSTAKVNTTKVKAKEAQARAALPELPTVKHNIKGNVSNTNLDPSKVLNKLEPIGLPGPNDDSKFNYSELGMFAPALGNLATLLSTASKSADVLNIPRVSTGRRLDETTSYNPLDTSYLMNRIAGQAGSSRRFLQDTAAGNRGAATAGMLASDMQYTGSIADTYLQATQMNLAQRAQNKQITNQARQVNLQMDLQEQAANQQAYLQEWDINAKK